MPPENLDAAQLFYSTDQSHFFHFFRHAPAARSESLGSAHYLLGCSTPRELIWLYCRLIPAAMPPMLLSTPLIHLLSTATPNTPTTTLYVRRLWSPATATHAAQHCIARRRERYGSRFTDLEATKIATPSLRRGSLLTSHPPPSRECHAAVSGWSSQHSVVLVVRLLVPGAAHTGTASVVSRST